MGEAKSLGRVGLGPIHREYSVSIIIAIRLETEGARDGISMLDELLGRGSRSRHDFDDYDSIDAGLESRTAPKPLRLLLTASHRIAAETPGYIAGVNIGSSTPLHGLDAGSIAVTIEKVMDDGRKYYVSIVLTVDSEDSSGYEPRETATYWVEVAARAGEDVPVHSIARTAAQILTGGQEN